MRDVYLYGDCDVLKNLLNIKDKALLDEAEAASPPQAAGKLTLRD